MTQPASESKDETQCDQKKTKKEWKRNTTVQQKETKQK
jgi:hypothetical protein